MTIVFELGPDFFRWEDIPLSVDDLKYGFEHGMISATTAIDLAVREVERGDVDPVLPEVASLLRDDADELPDVLAQLDAPGRANDPGLSARRWLYLQLRAAYDRRRDLADPLGVVEELYADFDYPPRIEGFVRYMPLRADNEPGEAALFDRWAAYLDTERDALSASPADGEGA